MTPQGKVIVVTGGAHGIGRALVERFAREGASAVIIVDRERGPAEAVAAAVGGFAETADVGSEAAVKRTFEAIFKQHGRIDLCCSNAGISVRGDFETVADEAWQRIWHVNVMAHVYTVRALLPRMLEAGGGYLLHTASAAGLLTQIGGAPYAVTKHAAVAFAEWIAITYGDRGIKVSCLCPQGVNTRMLKGAPDDTHAMLDQGTIEPEAVADAVIAGLAAEQFLILPHHDVGEYMRRKAADPDRWIRGMRRLQQRIRESS